MLCSRSASTHAARPSIGIHNSGAHFFMCAGGTGDQALNHLKSAASRGSNNSMQSMHGFGPHGPTSATEMVEQVARIPNGGAAPACSYSCAARVAEADRPLIPADDDSAGGPDHRLLVLVCEPDAHLAALAPAVERPRRSVEGFGLDGFIERIGDERLGGPL